MNKVLRLLIVFLCIISTNAFSGMQEGIDAVQRGDYQTAYKEFKPLAESGNLIAQTAIGLMYSHGDGVIQNYKEAVKWYTLAAEQGDAKAQYNLAQKYYYGVGVSPNNVYAHMWMNIATANGIKEGADERDKYAKNMTSSQIQQAQDLAR